MTDFLELLVGEEGLGTVYALNKNHTNRIWLQVQPGRDDEGRRVSEDEVMRYARLIAAAPDLLKAARVLAEIPVESFGKQDRPEYPLMTWNGHELNVGHVISARASIAKALGESA